MKIDSTIFRLHTNATVILLVTFSIAVTTRQYVGSKFRLRLFTLLQANFHHIILDPIDCVHTRDIPEDGNYLFCNKL